MSKFSYEGPVYYFDEVLTSKWKGGFTVAPTEKKALNNLTFRAKSSFGYSPRSKITLNPKYLKEEV